MLYAFPNQVCLGLVHFVNEDFEKVAAVDVVLARGLAQEYQVFFASKLLSRLYGNLSIEGTLWLDLRLLP